MLTPNNSLVLYCRISWKKHVTFTPEEKFQCSPCGNIASYGSLDVFVHWLKASDGGT